MDVTDRIVYSLLDTGNTYSVITFFFGPLSSQFCILRVAEKSMTRNCILPLSCLWYRYYFTHFFLIIQSVQCLYSEETSFSYRGLEYLIGENPVLRPLLQMLVMQTEDLLNTAIATWERQNDSEVWDTGGFSRAKNAIPVLVGLKDPSQFPHQKQ